MKSDPSLERIRSAAKEVDQQIQRLRERFPDTKVAPSEELTGSSPGELIIVPIHGTFVRSASFSQTDSTLAVAIRTAINQPVLMDPFCWSGANNHSDRLRAAEALCSKVFNLRLAKPLAKIVLLAHSHGGNIALLAARDERVGKEVAGIVCMATPFLNIRVRNIKQMFRAAQIGLGGAGLIFSLFCFVAMIDWSIFLAPLAVAIALLLACLVPSALETLEVKANRLTDRMVKEFALEEVVPPVMVVTNTGDEARIWLRLVGITFNFGQAVFDFLVEPIIIAAWIGGCALYVASKFRLELSCFAWLPLVVVTIPTFLATYAAALLVVWAFALGTSAFLGTPIAHGWSWLAYSWCASMRVSPVPQLKAAFTEVHIKTRWRLQLRHSAVYQDKNALSRIAGQISAWIKAKPTVPG